jgi:glyoxylase-like metal-dependent hydrolase (beta-lactamase superfamily II)
VNVLERHGLELEAIALTHAHLDHVGGVAALKRLKPEAKIILHMADEPLYRALPEQPSWIGIPREQWAMLGFDYEEPPLIDEYWTDGQLYLVGELSFKVLHCPGHTPGHVVLFNEEEGKVFVGDCLFAGSIGRSDLPGGSGEQLMDSLMNKIMPLGDHVIVYSGHSPLTTIGRHTNPFSRQWAAFSKEQACNSSSGHCRLSTVHCFKLCCLTLSQTSLCSLVSWLGSVSTGT